MALLIPALILLAAATMTIVVLPLIRRGQSTAGAAAHDRAVYRDQLREVELDLARGVLSASEAASARLEIERRLLATGEAEGAAAAKPRRRIPVAIGIAIVVTVWAAGFYLVLGTPGVPDMPLAARLAQDAATEGGHRDVEEAAARLEARLNASGGDADGWLLLAKTETGLRHWDKSAEAYRHVLELAPDTAGVAIRVAYAETLVLAAQGIVTPAAKTALDAALANDPGDPVARYYLALADAQAGKAKQAIAAWLKLAAELPADSDMRAAIEQRVHDAAQQAGTAPPPLPPPADRTDQPSRQ